MKIRSPLAFAVILAVTAVAGGCSDSPMAPAPEEAGLGAPARRNVSPDPLMVAVNCGYYRSGLVYDTPELFCHATASGGTGTGYTFSWSPGTFEHQTDVGNNLASISCDYISYHTSGAWLQVWDSGGGFQQVDIGPSQCWYMNSYYYSWDPHTYYAWKDRPYYSPNHPYYYMW
jgi:hypothetical protein